MTSSRIARVCSTKENMNQLTLPFCCVAFASLLYVPGKTHAEQQPNVLWILTDDQRYDSIGAFNRILQGRDHSELGYVESPNVDQLATMGTTFINTYCQAPGCAPSRQRHSGFSGNEFPVFHPPTGCHTPTFITRVLLAPRF